VGRRRKVLLARGGRDPADVWPDIRAGARWRHQAAPIRCYQDQCAAWTGQRRRGGGGRLGAMPRYQTVAWTLAPALAPCRKVTRRDWPGRFACYPGPALPRTKHALEPFVGASRSHDRRPTGRQGASPSLVLSGAGGVMAAAAPRRPIYSAAARAPANVRAWQAWRPARETRRPPRSLRRRLRRDPASELAKLEAHLLQLSLPP
jgi:hypothetical protein